MNNEEFQEIVVKHLMKLSDRMASVESTVLRRVNLAPKCLQKLIMANFVLM